MQSIESIANTVLAILVKTDLSPLSDDEDFGTSMRRVILWQAERIAKLESEVASLGRAAVVAKLPKCWRLNEEGGLVQNVPIVPRMEVWFWNGFPDCRIENETVWSIHQCDGEWCINDDSPPHYFYSTREAAEAARINCSQPAEGAEV